MELLRQGQRPFGWASQIPLHENYAGKSLKRIQQDVYDRFFTRIEQRFSRKEKRPSLIPIGKYGFQRGRPIGISTAKGEKGAIPIYE